MTIANDDEWTDFSLACSCLEWVPWIGDESFYVPFYFWTWRVSFVFVGLLIFALVVGDEQWIWRRLFVFEFGWVFYA